MNHDEESQIKEAFERLDQGIEISAPNAATLSMMLSQKKKEYNKMQKKELGFFIVIASFLIILLTMVLAKAPVVYFIIQILGISSVPCIILLNRKKQNREDSAL